MLTVNDRGSSGRGSAYQKAIYADWGNLGVMNSLGLATERAIYPGQFHSLTIPSYQRDRLQRYLDWFNRYLAPSGATSAGR